MLHRSQLQTHPLGSQKCDTVDELSVCVQIASRIQSRVWTEAPSETAILTRIFAPPKSTADPHGGAICVILSSNPASANKLQAKFTLGFGGTAPSESADSGANPASPEFNCRPTWGSHMCDTVVEPSVSQQIASQIHSRVWRHSSERERDSGTNPTPPRSQLLTPMGEPCV